MMRKILYLYFLIFSLATFAKDYVVSDHYDGKKFFNPEANIDHNLWDILKWKLPGSASEWPESVSNNTYQLPVLTPTQKGQVTFINHATFLIQLTGLNVLTDPIFSERASPFHFIGPKRVRAPGIELERLPKIDVVVISHNHYDHLDLETLKILDGKFKPLFLVPLGDEKLLKKAGIQNVQEMDWWEEKIIKDHKITFTPTQHWSARGLFDRHKSLWGSYFISSDNVKIYFGGDSGYASHYRNIRLRLGEADLSLLPIGAYDPPYIMKVSHLNPEEAVQAHRDLGSKLSIGMHFGTFQLTDEPINEPIERLNKTEVPNFIVLDQGESKDF